jgi:5-dehydro-2-deoxygluconokinase
LLGLDAPQSELETAFAAVSGISIVKGFAVGRTIFSAAAQQWLAGRISDKQAIHDMASRFEKLTQAWQKIRETKVT